VIDTLRATYLLDPEAVGLDVAQPTARLADASRDALGEVDVGRVEGDVVGDQEGARPDGDGTGRGMHPRRPEVGRATDLVDLDLQPLVLPAAHVRELLPLGARGRSRVQEDRQIEARRDALAEAPRELDAVVHRRRAQRDEWNDVDSTDARVLARVDVH